MVAEHRLLRRILPINYSRQSNLRTHPTTPAELIPTGSQWEWPIWFGHYRRRTLRQQYALWEQKSGLQRGLLLPEQQFLQRCWVLSGSPMSGWRLISGRFLIFRLLRDWPQPPAPLFPADPA